jgi:hypothetical protein
MKKILIVSLICLTFISLVGCENNTPVNVNVENKNNLSNTVFGKSALVKIGDGLWYDSTTRIVYFWNGKYSYQSATTPSPYYAPNGLPYKYNPETNTFEEIK